MTHEPMGHLTLALQTLADQSADPHRQSGWANSPITGACFEQLFRWGVDGTLVPALASRVEESPDHLTLMFKLRDDATFWDGSPVTAEDAKWSFERYVSLSPVDAFQDIVNRAVRAVEAPDAHTMVVHLYAPSTQGLSWGPIAPQGWNVASRTYYHKVGEEAFRRRPLCTGPFRLVENEAGLFTRLEAYAGHYERVPFAKTIRLDVVPDQAARLERLQTGEADFIDGIAGPALAGLQADPRLEVHQVEATTCAVLFFQEPDKPPYNDVRVRKALRYAVDQQAIISGPLHGAGSPSVGAAIFPMTHGFEAARFPPQEYDLEQARALLAEAGFGGGFKTSISFYDAGMGTGTAAQLPQMMDAVAGMWQKIGVHVDLERPEWYLAKYRAHQLGGLAPLGTAATVFASYLLKVYYLPGDHDGYGNYGVRTTPEIAAKIRALAREFDAARHAQLAQEVYTDIVDEAWSISLPYAHTSWAVRKDRIRQWTPHQTQRSAHAFETLIPA